MSLNTENLKSTIIEALSANGFNFDIMPNHTVYDQVTSGDAKGIAKLDSDNNPIILQQYDEPALAIMMESVASGIVDRIKNDMIIDDISNVTVTDIQLNDMLLYGADGWENIAGYDKNIWNANKLQNRAISTTAPTDGQVLAWDSTTSSYVPTTI